MPGRLQAAHSSAQGVLERGGIGMRLSERIGRLEAHVSPAPAVMTIHMPEWRLPTQADRDAWRAEHVAPLQGKCGILVVLRDMFGPGELEGS